MSITVQSLSAKAPVGMVAEESDDHPSGVYVFSSAQKYRLILDMDLSGAPQVSSFVRLAQHSVLHVWLHVCIFGMACFSAVCEKQLTVSSVLSCAVLVAQQV
jgi:hypothetical protein